MKKPNFFILGAPKCGTTSLAAWLSEHPNVYFCPRKEPHFFNQNGHTATFSIEAYEALFQDARDHHEAVGEGSTHYLYSREAVPNILAYNPGARFIVSLRNPIDMAPALHGELLKQGQETVQNFEEAWALQHKRRSGRRIPLTAIPDPERLQYGRYCRLGEQLERLYSTVDEEQVIVAVLDDLARDPGSEYRKMLRFLELPDDGRRTFPIRNEGRRVRSPRISFAIRALAELKRRVGVETSLGLLGVIKAANLANEPRPRISEHMKKELWEYFSEDIRRLEELLGRNLNDWQA